MYNKIFSPKRIVLTNGKTVLEKRSKAPFVLFIICVAVYYSAQATGFNFAIIFRRINEFFTIVLEMLQPNWNYLDGILPELFVTLKMSFLGSIIGAIVALPTAVLASSNIIKNKIIYGLFKMVLSLLRTMPTLVMALIATYLFALPATAGTVAIFLFTVSYVGKLLFEAIENVDMGAFQAMQSIGMTRIQSFRYAIFPQILPSYLSTSLFCFEGNVRYAAILGYIGAGGIGNLINETIGWRDYSSLGMIVLMLVITVYVIETFSEHFRKKLM
ncbi:phosphonate ABC transporter, permease protein PhnE [Amphibacillus jilinensis]|uniref:phosphonate ABC transporter, permease protein PhnE n=1 Tax=Amphibacillus jilinensis TaxID=1216008 RepID=UPI0002EFD447|nr:phosphonate ABC transporter, permease protein PhnE [Amphibacillus jilinensis]